MAYPGTYDYTTLRMGVGCFCFGYEFADTFLNPNPGGPFFHDRAYTGPEGLTDGDYAGDFLYIWGLCWYDYEVNSWTAYSSAATYAEHELYDDMTPWSYDDTVAGGIYCQYN